MTQAFDIKPLTSRTAILTLKDRMTAANAPILKEQIKKLIASGIVELIFDLGQVTFLDSSGLAVLVSALKATHEKNGWVRLSGMNPQVQSIFQMTMLDRVFEIYPDVESALQAVASSQ